MTKTFERLLCGVWLIACTLFLAAFSGILRDQILGPKNITWIDSWEDLYHWKHLKIQIDDVRDLNTFIKNNPDHPYSKDFSERIEIIILHNVIDFTKYNIEKIKAGKIAIVAFYEMAQLIMKILISDNFQEDVDFHISNYGRGPEDESYPYFSLINKALNETIVHKYYSM